MILIKNLGGVLQIEGLPINIKSSIQKSLQLPNPKYHQLLRMGNYRAAQWAGEFIPYYKEDKKTGDLIIGRGCLDGLKLYLTGLKQEFKYENLSVEVPVKIPKSSIVLRDYQIPVFEDIKSADKTSFITKLSTGFGKSVIALKIAENLNQRTLIVCPRIHLMSSYSKDIKNLFGFEAGIIQGSKCDIKPITLTTLQTLDSMVRKKTISKISDSFGLCIFDEIQTLLTKKKIKVVQSFKCKYLVGLSATLDNEEKQGKSLNFTIGKVVSDRELPMAKPKVFVYQTGIEIPARNYPDMVQSMIESDERNILIADIIKKEIKNGSKLLVLVKRVAHLELINKHLPKEDGIKTLYARDKKEQLELLEGLRRGTVEFDVILGSFSFLAVGTDCDRINMVLLAGDLKGHTLTTQSIGRCTRLLTGKAQAGIIDLHDEKSTIMHRQFLHRRKLYNEKGYEIIQRSPKNGGY